MKWAHSPFDRHHQLAKGHVVESCFTGSSYMPKEIKKLKGYRFPKVRLRSK